MNGPFLIERAMSLGPRRYVAWLATAPRVGEAGVSMECVLDRVLPLGSDHLVLGRVVRFHVRDDLYGQNGRIDVSKLSPLGRLAGDYTGWTLHTWDAAAASR